jgi:RNA polymerase sigma-70 factor (ECF subfamily)
MTHATDSLAAQWVETHGDYLLGFAMMRVRDRDAAEDLVQETFVAAISAQRDFAGQSTIRTWLTGILKNKIADHFRKAARMRSFDMGDDLENSYFGADDHWKRAPGKWKGDPSEVVRHNELRIVLQNCLDALPSGLAQVFVLRDLEEMDADAVCATLQITASNLYTALHRARFRLRRCVEAKWFEKETA